MFTNRGQSIGRGTAMQKLPPAPKRPGGAVRPPSMLDMLPTKTGRAPKPHVAHTIRKLSDSIQADRNQRARQQPDRTSAKAVARFKQSNEYLAAMRDAAHSLEAPIVTLHRNGPATANFAARDAPRPSAAGPDRPRSDAELRRFLATGERTTRAKQNLGPGHMRENSPLPVKALARVVQDYADMQANIVPATIHLAGEAAQGHVKQVAHDLITPYIETAKHPLKSLVEHPVQTLALAEGVRAGASRGAGKVARTGLVGATAKRVASTVREDKVLPGTSHREEQSYSKDPMVKAVQVAVEKRKNGGGPAVVSESDLRRSANEHEAAREDLRRAHRSQTVKQTEAATGKKPNAATVLSAQNIAHATPEDLTAYRNELAAEADKLREIAKTDEAQAARRSIRDKLRRNEAARAAIEKAIANLKGDEGARGADYAKVNLALQQRLGELGILDSAGMEMTRLTAPAARHMGGHTLTPAQLNEMVTSARQAVKDSQAELRRQGKTRDASVAGFGVARGRAQILSRNVGGRAAEDLAQRRTAPVDVNQFAGGGHGVTQAAEALRHGTANVDEATAKVKGAIDHLRSVVAMRKQGGGLRGEGDVPLTPEMIRANPEVAAFGHEPAYVSHAPNQRGAKNFNVPRKGAPQVVAQPRTGAAVREGTADLHPQTLVEANVRAQGIIDAAESYGAALNDVGLRKGNGELHQFKTRKDAQDHADHAIRDENGHISPNAVPMIAVRLNPFMGRKAQLEGLLDLANEGAHTQVHDILQGALKGEGDGSGEWALIPRAFADQLHQHMTVGGNTLAHTLFRLYGATWRKNVLAFSPKWLTGNVVEAALRAAIAHAGIRSYVTMTKAMSRLERIDPEAAAELRARAAGGGHYSLATRNTIHTPGEKFAGTSLAHVATAMGKLLRAPGAKNLADAWKSYTDFVFNTMNGKIESQFQIAMMGKALRDHPLMSDHLRKLSNDALDEAARGLTETKTQVALGREVDRMFGRYSKFGPSMRHWVAAYTPFIAWSINAAYFLFRTLPRDHPVLTSLMASASQATEEWRRQHNLVSQFAEHVTGALPGFLQGSIPGKGGSHLPISRYTPFGLYDNKGGVFGALGSAFVPQIMDMLNNVQGMDWKGASLAGPHQTPVDVLGFVAAATSFIEDTIPLTSKITAVAGVRLPNEAPGAEKGNLGDRARRAFDPFRYQPGKGGGSSGVTVDKGGGTRSGGLAPLPPLPALPSLPPLPALPAP